MLFVSTAANKTKTCKSIIKMTRVYKKKKWNYSSKVLSFGMFKLFFYLKELHTNTCYKCLHGFQISTKI